MATLANRDVPLTLSVDTVGTESIKKLKADIAALGKEGADAIPEFAALGAEIDRLASQSALVSTMRDLADQVDALSVAQADAAAKSKALHTEFSALHTETASLSAIEKALKADVVEAQRALFDKRQELAKLKNGTTDYKDEAQKLNAVIIDSKTDLRNLIEDYTAAKAATAQAAAAEKELGNELKQAEAATKAASAALSTRNAALSESKAALQAMGAATKDVATAEADLVSSYTKVSTAIADTSAALKLKQQATAEMLESDRLLAIEQRGMAELFEKGRVALIAETTAIQEAERSSRQYTAAQQAETAARAAANAAWQAEAEAIVNGVEAKQKMLRETQNLLEAYQFLAKEDAAAKWQREAEAIVDAAEATQRLEREARLLAEAEEFLANEAIIAAAAVQKVEAAAQEAGAALDTAFRTVGVRSAEDIRAEIAKVEDALDLLKSSGRLTGAELDNAFAKGSAKIKLLERDLREANNQLTLGDKAAKLFSGSLAQISAGNVVADGVGYLVEKVKDLGRAFLGAIVQGDQLKRGLNAVYKDAGLAAQQIDFLRKSSSESGVAFSSLSQEFVKFSASMKMANIPMEQSNALFAAVTRASASLGLSADATAGTLNALGQMASKGTVSLEELRAQLGDRLPGALGLTAKGLGITEGELIKLVESGQLATRDFVVPFTKALAELQGSTEGLIPTWERLKGVLSETAQSAGDSGWTQLLTLGLKGLGAILTAVTLALAGFSEVLMLAGRGVLALYGVLRGDAGAWEFFTKSAEDAGGRLQSLRDAWAMVIDPAKASAAAATESASALTANTAAATNAIAANNQLDISQKLAALSAKLAADGTLDAGAKIVQYTAAAAQLRKEQESQTDAYDKLAKAAKEQGATLVENAKLTGDNTAVQTAALQAAQLYAEAVDKASASHQLETAALIAQRAELLANASGRDGGTAAVKVQIEALDKLITASKAETEQSVQAQAAARAEVAARQLASAALLDNSTRLDAYAAAVAGAKAEVEFLTAMEQAGHNVKVELAAAQQQLTTATYMQNDAIKDLTTNIQLDTQVKSANLQLSIAQATASQNHYTAMAVEARASGDVAAAVRYEIKAKEESIRILKLKLELDELQQQSDLLVIEIKRKLIDAETDEGKQKLKLLDIETQMIKIKAAGNQAVLDQIKVLERQSIELRTNTSNIKENGDAIRGNSGPLSGDTDLRNANVSAINSQSAALKRLADITSRPGANAQPPKPGQTKYDPGYGSPYSAPGVAPVNGDGQTKEEYDREQFLTGQNAVDNTLQFKLRDKLNNGTLTAADVADVQNVVNALDQNEKQNSWLRGQGAISSSGLIDDQQWQGVNGQFKAFLNDQKSKSATSGTSGISAAGVTMNINIGGVSTPVNVASQSDANNLQSVLSQLANAQGRSI